MPHVFLGQDDDFEEDGSEASQKVFSKMSN